MAASSAAAFADSECVSGYEGGSFINPFRPGSYVTRCVFSYPRRPAPQAAPAAMPVGPGSKEVEYFDATSVRRKMQVRHNEPGTAILGCPAPYHMTARDGCQP